MDSTPPLAAMALSLMVQDWNVLGFGDDPSVASTSDIDVVVERITALLLVRIVAIQAPLGTFQDLSTSNICRTVIMKSKPWPETITPQVIEQLQEFVKKMVYGYKDTPYHNFEHAYHVTISISRLLDLVLSSGVSNGTKKERPPPSYGLRNDPLNQMAMIFAALVHDVEHQGIPNRQLALEDDRLAILYNDQSIAENWSLYIAFSELLQDEFKGLREVMFGPDGQGYSHFRRTVVNLVLNTDIASPERTQISKSKWKEAFGDPYETVERKIRAEARRMSLGLSLTGQDLHTRGQEGRRGSTAYSDISGEDYTHSRNEDDSLSGTPENSVHNEDNEVIQEVAPAEPLASQSMHVYPAGAGQQEFDRSVSMNMSAHGHNPSTKFGRRFSSASRRCSTSSATPSKYRYRLGILRTVDLSGETIETYQRGSMGTTTGSVVSAEKPNSVDLDMDEPDELKMTVVMETMMTAADVAHNLQGWEHMVKWSGRLYMELRRAYQAKRGFDPQHRWFENQIGFLESYLLPLAHRLDDLGVFGPEVGPAFASIVEDNRDRWLTQGYDATQKVIIDGAELYPVDETEEE
jgi:hypothetical protein